MAEFDRDPHNENREFFIPDLCAVQPILFLIIVTELLAVVYVLATAMQPQLDWEKLALLSLFVQWVVLLCAATLCVSRQVLGGLVLYQSVSISLLIIVIVTALVSLLAREFLPYYWPADYALWWFWRNIAVALVLGGIALRYFYLQYQLRMREQLALQSRLQALQARIRPHFLFNTMNSIASLIGSQPDKAERVLEDLCELLRASLSEYRSTVTLAEELRLCRLYLHIEQLRLDSRLQINWQVDPGLESEQIPSLILQPLLENAVHHGVAQLRHGGEISVRIFLQGKFVCLQVGNPIPETETVSHTSGYHLGLDNISQCLSVLYGASAEMDVTTQEGYHTVVLSCPRDEDLP